MCELKYLMDYKFYHLHDHCFYDVCKQNLQLTSSQSLISQSWVQIFVRVFFKTLLTASAWETGQTWKWGLAGFPQHQPKIQRGMQTCKMPVFQLHWWFSTRVIDIGPIGILWPNVASLYCTNLVGGKRSMKLNLWHFTYVWWRLRVRIFEEHFPSLPSQGKPSSWLLNWLPI